jgi:hypothetical protein
MLEIEKHYNSFLYQLNKIFKPGNDKDPTIIKAYKKALNNMVVILSSLNNIYPPSVLMDSFDSFATNLKQNPVILDNTTLAGGDDQNWAFEIKVTAKKVNSKKTIKEKITQKKNIQAKSRLIKQTKQQRGKRKN